jgi:cellulose synthase/poly-beta-1,6-N-acetylglucosamine synthase-like glycosyltransferase
MMFLLVALFLLQLVIWWGIYRRMLEIPATSPCVGPCPPLSVLVAARNASDDLLTHLPKVLAQDYPVFEVLVVNDDSADNTVSVLETLRARYPHLRVFTLAPKVSPGKKAALQMAIHAARYDWLVFTDADCAPASDQWLRYLAGAMKPDVDIVLGYAPFFPEQTLWHHWVRFESDMAAVTYLSLAQLGMPYMGVGRNVAWRKKLFRQTGGYSTHAHLPGGDDDLMVNAAARRSNTSVVLSAEAFVYSAAKSDWRGWLRQKKRHLSAGRAYKPTHQAVLAALSFSRALFHLCCAVLVLQGQWVPALVALAGRWAVVWPVGKTLQRRLKAPDHMPQLDHGPLNWTLPFFDLCLSVYDAFWVSWSLWVKPKGW